METNLVHPFQGSNEAMLTERETQRKDEQEQLISTRPLSPVPISLYRNEEERIRRQSIRKRRLTGTRYYRNCFHRPRTRLAAGYALACNQTLDTFILWQNQWLIPVALLISILAVGIARESQQTSRESALFTQQKVIERYSNKLYCHIKQGTAFSRQKQGFRSSENKELPSGLCLGLIWVPVFILGAYTSRNTTFP